MDLKLLKITRVFHVGTLDINKKVKGSYEGSGLSVSNCPDAWRKINRGATYGETWNVKKETGGLFVDYHNTMNEKVKETLKLWGLLNNYITECVTYSFSYYDDEAEETIGMSFLDREEAELEAENYEEDIKTETGILATEKLLRECCQNVNAELLDYYDLLLTLYVEKNHKGIDGIWWEDNYTPECYSAPRGVIFNSKIGEWQCFIGEDEAFESGCQDILDFEEDYYY